MIHRIYYVYLWFSYAWINFEIRLFVRCLSWFSQEKPNCKACLSLVCVFAVQHRLLLRLFFLIFSFIFSLFCKTPAPCQHDRFFSSAMLFSAYCRQSFALFWAYVFMMLHSSTWFHLRVFPIGIITETTLLLLMCLPVSILSTIKPFSYQTVGGVS